MVRKSSEAKVTQSCQTLCDPMYYTAHGILQARMHGYPFPSPEDLPNPGIEPRSPTLQVDSLAAEPTGKPKNTGVGSLSLLQGLFPTQGSNPGLPHCREILYQLSYQGSPEKVKEAYNLITIKSKKDLKMSKILAIYVSQCQMSVTWLPRLALQRGSPIEPYDYLQLGHTPTLQCP